MYGHFNPRSPHGERQRHNSGTSEYDYFNPRSPHGERRVKIFTTKAVRNFNPRSPHGERQRQQMRQINRRRISIHAPRTGSDSGSKCGRSIAAVFQSTLPARGATAAVHTCRHGVNISIHAPRTGSDSCSRLQVRGSYNFNPRSPHGERQATIAQLDNKTAFQSTLPARGATIPYIDKLVNSKISIHAPRTGSDIINGLMARGGAISIHAPRTGSDRHAWCGIAAPN